LGADASQEDVSTDPNEPPLGEPIGPDRATEKPAHLKKGRGEDQFVPGKWLQSQQDQDLEFLIVSGPPRRPPRQAPQKRKAWERAYEQWGGTQTSDAVVPLPTPAQLAADHGGQRARPVRACPNPRCWHPLPASIDIRDPLSIAVVGNTGASKTTTLMALVSEMQRNPAGLGVGRFNPTERTLRRHRQVLASFRDGRAEGTEGEKFHDALEFNGDLDGRPAALLLHDVAGDDVSDPDRRLMWAPYALWADVILFIYNPEESPKESKRQGEPQAGVLNGVRDDLEQDPPKDLQGRPRWPKLVVAVSKADTLDSAPDLTGGPLEESAVVRIVHSLGDSGIVHAAERWDEPRWRLIAPQPEYGDPYGVTDLFRLVLSLAAA
jgi:hypothetical protein